VRTRISPGTGVLQVVDRPACGANGQVADRDRRLPAAAQDVDALIPLLAIHLQQRDNQVTSDLSTLTSDAHQVGADMASAESDAALGARWLRTTAVEPRVTQQSAIRGIRRSAQEPSPLEDIRA
jgi:hypothetical protein